MGYQEQVDFDAASGADEEERERRMKSPQERWGCACPRIDATDCIEFRSRPPWVDDSDKYTESDEECECHCHVMDDDDLADDGEAA